MTKNDIETYLNNAEKYKHELYQNLCALDLDDNATRYIISVIDDNYSKKLEYMKNLWFEIEKNDKSFKNN